MISFNKDQVTIDVIESLMRVHFANKAKKKNNHIMSLEFYFELLIHQFSSNDRL